MIKKIIILFNALILLSGYSYGQFLKDTLFFNANGQVIKTFDSTGYYRIVSIDSSSQYQFLVEEYYSNHNPKIRGTYRSLNPDRKNGKYISFYPNGNKSLECYYSDNILNGNYKAWYENGTLKYQAGYKNNKLHGSSKLWSETGVLKKIVEYKNGLKDGEFISYYPNGNPIRRDKYKNDKLIKGICFTPAGKDTAYFKYFSPPSFLGGDISKFTKWVIEKLQYPKEAKSNKVEGEVKVKFTVNKNGIVTGIHITKLDKSYFNSEVIRVISDSPKWKPAIRDIDSIDVSVEIPIRFELPKDIIKE